jgi:hypothetical protein
MVSKPVRGDIITVEWLKDDELLVYGSYTDGGMACIALTRPYKDVCIMWNPYIMTIVRHMSDMEIRKFDSERYAYLREKGRAKLKFRTVEY